MGCLKLGSEIMLGEGVAAETIDGTGMLARCLALASHRQGELFAILAHPANLPPGHTNHQCIGLDVFIDHGPGSDECVFTDRHATDEGTVGTQRSASFDKCVAILAFAFDQ